MFEQSVFQAPAGTTMSNIEGNIFVPDEKGEVRATSPDQIRVLAAHGYTFLRNEPLPGLSQTAISTIAPNVSSTGPIEADELGRVELQMALRARGVSFPDDAGRAALVKLAERWNGQDTAAKQAAPLRIEIEELSRPQLILALRARGFGLSDDLPRESLVSIAQRWNDEHCPSSAPAPAATAEHEAETAPEKAPKTPRVTGEETVEEVKVMAYPALKAYAKIKGISFTGTPKADELRAIILTALTGSPHTQEPEAF